MMKGRRINEHTRRISLVFLIGAEIVFWLSAIGFFLLRYGFRLKKASFIMGIVLLVNEVFILTLGVVDYYQTGKFSNFQIITVIILLYAVFYGKKDLKKLDIFAQKSVAKWRNEPAPIIEEQVELIGMAYAKQEIKIGYYILFYSLVCTYSFSSRMDLFHLNNGVIG